MTTIRLNGVTVMTDALVLADAGALPGSSGLSALGMSPDAVSPGLTIGANGKPVSAALDMQSIQGALLLPRLPTSAYTNSSFTPYNGMILYDTTLNTYLSYSSGSWSSFGSGSGGVSYSAGTTPAGVNIIPVFADNTGTKITSSGVTITSVTTPVLLNHAINKNIKAPSLTYYRIGTTIGSSSALDAIVFGNNEGTSGVGGLYVGSLLAQEFLENSSAITTLITDGLPGTTTTVSAALEIQSSSRGVLLPRLASASITNPVSGLLYYDNVLNNFCGYVGGSPTRSQIVATSSTNPFNPPTATGTNGYFLQLSNATTGATQWSSAVTSVAAGTNLTGGTITSTGTIALSSTPSGLTSLGVGNLSLSGNSITTNAPVFTVYDKFGMGFNSVSSSSTSTQLDMWCSTYKNTVGTIVGQDWIRWQYDGSNQPNPAFTNPNFFTYFFSNLRIDPSCFLLVNNVSAYSGTDIFFNNNLNMNNNPINNVTTITTNSLNSNQTYIDCSGKYLGNVHDPLSPQDAVTLNYITNNNNTIKVSSLFTNALNSNQTYIDCSGKYLGNVHDPLSPQDAATKNYVDTKSSFSGPITFTGTVTLHGSSPVSGTYGWGNFFGYTTHAVSTSCSLITGNSILADSFLATSSIKKKSLISKESDFSEELTNKFKTINFHEYKYKDILEHGNMSHYGVIAEELNEIFPQMVYMEPCNYVPNIMMFALLNECRDTLLFEKDIKERLNSKKLKIFNDTEEIKVEIVKQEKRKLFIKPITTKLNKEDSKFFVYGTYEKCPAVAKERLFEIGMVVLKNALKRIEILEEKLKIEKH